MYFFNNISINNDSIDSIDEAGDHTQAATEQLQIICVQFSVFTMTFAIQLCDWLICVVWMGINQSQTSKGYYKFRKKNCNLFIKHY